MRASSNRKNTNSFNIKTSQQKYPEVFSWLSKNEESSDVKSLLKPIIGQNNDFSFENFEKLTAKKSQWTSEPELFEYQPGCVPKKHLFDSQHKYYLNRRKEQQLQNDNNNKGLDLDNTIRSSDLDHSSDLYDSNSGNSASDEDESNNFTIYNRNIHNNNNHHHHLNKQNKHSSKYTTNNNTNTLHQLQSFNRKAQRRHKMKYGRKLESSKSDSYHRTYVWDMVLNDKAIMAIKEEYRQFKKLAKQNARRMSCLDGTLSDCSQTQQLSDMVAQGMSLKEKLTSSNSSNVNNLLLRSISQRYNHNMRENKGEEEEEIRKISQTGSAIFAHIDAERIRQLSGRHPAQSSSKEDSKTGSSNIVSKSNSREKFNFSTKPIARGSQKQQHEPQKQNNFEQISAFTSGHHSTNQLSNITDSRANTNSLSLQNNNNSVGGTNSYYNNSSSGVGTYAGYPGAGYLDPMLLQALVMGNLFNPILNYQGQIDSQQEYQQQVPQQQQAQPQQLQQSQNIYTPFTNQLPSSNGGYPLFQQEMISQMLSAANSQPQDSINEHQSSNNNNIQRQNDSSEESEDIRPSRHAIYDDENDLHVKKSHRHSHHHRHSKSKNHNFERTKTYFSSPVQVDKFRPESVIPQPQNINTSTTNTSVTHYLTKLKTCVETLKSSGWYWNKISSESAMAIVEKKGLGAFLIRDSSHQKYLFTLTVHTTNGPTNVRILFKHGHFGLDCDGSAKDNSGIRFNCVVAMIAHYVNNSRKFKKIEHRRKKRGEEHHETNNNASNSIALLLLAPCKKTVPTLQHLARVAINKKLSKKSARNAGLKLEDLLIKKDQNLIEYCRKYPYNV